MSFEQHYTSLINYASSLIEKGNSVSASDVVADAFIYFSDKQFDILRVKKWIYWQIKIDQSKQKDLYLSVVGKNDEIQEHDRVCKKCNDIKPIAAYTRTWVERLRKYQILDTCKECYNKAHRKEKKPKPVKVKKKKVILTIEQRKERAKISRRKYLEKQKLKPKDKTPLFSINQLIKIHQSAFNKAS